MVLRIRNALYDSGVFGITEFDIPIINVGNLAFGGTGKTPHTEYLIRLLSPLKKVAVLSRGYKRKSSGYVFGSTQSDAFILGDEPYQILTKFDAVSVAVCENRVLGVPNLLFDAPETEVILLDDAFQHRAIKPGLNLLLTEASNLFTRDQLVPSGYLREYASASKRADAIIVSKCAPDLPIENRKRISEEIQLVAGSHIPVYFSYIRYGEPMAYEGNSRIMDKPAVLAFAGIARTESFTEYLQAQYDLKEFKRFPDHHQLSETEIKSILTLFESIEESNKVIISTEKDMQKLKQSAYASAINAYPFYYLPIEIEFFEDCKAQFNQQILNYVQSN